MKKLLITLTIILSIGLTGCSIGDLGKTYTEEEVKDMFDDMIEEWEKENVILTEKNLQEAIDKLIAESNGDLSLIGLSSSIANMLNNTEGSVIGISNIGNSVSSTGSGVIYKKVDNTYYVVTNHHVVEGSVELSVVFEKNGILREIKDVTLVGSDATTDLAVLTFESDEDFQVVNFREDNELRKGELVFAIGSPLGFNYYNSTTMGVVSGLSRFVSNDNFETNVIQHDATINPGNSGGALVDVYGNLVGINNMKIVESDVDNIGFAIPTRTVKRIISDLEEYGVTIRPFLGIQSQPLTNGGVENGVYLETVTDGGAAKAAGLKAGDIIVSYNGEVVHNFLDLKEAILNSRVGDTVEIKYIRNGRTYTVSAELGVHPEDEGKVSNNN